MRMKIFLFVLLTCFMTAMVVAQEDMVTDSLSAMSPPAPVINFTGIDTPNDNGHSISLSWELSPDDATLGGPVTQYLLMRSESADGPFTFRDSVSVGMTDTKDGGVKEKTAAEYFPRETDFYYKIVAVAGDQQAESAVVGPVRGVGQWFNTGKSSVASACVLFTLLILFFIRRAKSGVELYIRPLAGIDAVDEAIGRATEMGKPILYILGLGAASDIATIASFTILSRVAKKVAEYQTSILVPCYDPIVMTIAQETVKTSYYDAGRPDAYNEDDVFFVTNQQFAYVGAVNGLMIREKPATNFYLGKFYAESLIMAETGSASGAIQIAGTDEVTQIPFFVVACDYTLIGEELYAASAYLGREPVLLGTLKGQDYGKALVIASILIGIVAGLVGWAGYIDLFYVGP